MLLFLSLGLFACYAQNETAFSDLDVDGNWRVQGVAEWQHDRPDMLQLSADRETLFLSFENKARTIQRIRQLPALGRIKLKTGASEVMLRGLLAADGLRLDQHGDLWLGEEVADGHVWHIRHPQSLPAEQSIIRTEQKSSHPDVTIVQAAGRMSHEGLVFSRDGRYLYLLDEWKYGALYRLQQANQKLQVFHRNKGWLAIQQPMFARQEAQRIGAARFNRGEDMERLPDGQILFAETDTGIIHILDDRAAKPTVKPWLQHKGIEHPDNLEWDEHRQWLWITDDSKPSELWVWDGNIFHRIVRNRNGEITGVETHPDGRVWINLQGEKKGMDQTVLLLERKD